MLYYLSCTKQIGIRKHVRFASFHRAILVQLANQEHLVNLERGEREETEEILEMMGSLELLSVTKHAVLKCILLSYVLKQGSTGAPGEPGDQGPEGPKVDTDRALWTLTNHCTLVHACTGN